MQRLARGVRRAAVHTRLLLLVAIIGERPNRLEMASRLRLALGHATAIERGKAQMQVRQRLVGALALRVGRRLFKERGCRGGRVFAGSGVRNCSAAADCACAERSSIFASPKMMYVSDDGLCARAA